MPTIRLTRAEWSFDANRRLGPPGGFGEVFQGEDADGAPVAVKRLNLTSGQAAHREMAIGESLSFRTLEYVVPVLDFGQDSEGDRYYLIMPVCSESLQDRLNAGSSSFADKISILLNIIEGLLEVGDVVHRDLKPGNVLLHRQRWKIADFGIAKFVEDSTSLITLRDSLTPSYGAPEQWRGERPTKATDVYALGCIAHALFNGRPPFVGSAVDVREGHLHQSPPAIDGPPSIAAVVSQMLRKSAEARPSLARVKTVLSTATEAAPSGPRGALSVVANQIATERAAAEAAAAEQKNAEKAWAALQQEALDEFRQIRTRLFAEVEEASGENFSGRNGFQWGAGHLIFGEPTSIGFHQSAKGRPASPNDWQRPTWEVASWCLASLLCRHPGGGSSYNIGSTLFYGRSPGHEFRWHEVAFWSWNNRDQDDPHGLDMSAQDASIALSNTMGVVSVAFGPVPIDGEDEESFQNRWLSLIGRAASGQLYRPNQMPPPSSFYT